jgi:hypothetical protein
MAKLVPVSHEEALDLNYPRSCLGSAFGLGNRGIYADFFLVDERRRRRERRKAAAQRRANLRWWDEHFGERTKGSRPIYAWASERIAVYAPPRLAMSGLSGARPTMILLDDPHA